MRRPRTDLDYDGAGRPEYNAATVDYIERHAARLGITFGEASEVYEKSLVNDTASSLNELEPDEEVE